MENFQSDRYKRHLLLPEIGDVGQRRLLCSSVLVIGAGGLGSPVLLYLAAAGVGKIGIVDFDVVDVSNLQRQVLFTTEDIGKHKAEVAALKLKSLNPEIEVASYLTRFSDDNAEALLADYDLVIEASDSLQTKYLSNDVCVRLGKPLVHGSINQFTGNVMTILPGAACLRCVFPEAKHQKDSSEYGVLGVVPGIAGSIQAAEAVKYLAGMDDLLVNRMLTFDAKSMNFFTIDISKSPDCICK